MPKWYLTGGGHKGTEACYFRKQAGRAARCLWKLIEKLRIHFSNKGSILIEFAVCMPVLIILLYYINDLSRLKRYYDQTEFVAQQMVNILQNIAKTKTITVNDLKDAASMAFLSIYPGTTMFADGKRGGRSHVLSHRPEFRIYYVQGSPEGKASVKWGWNGYCTTSTSPNTWQGGYIRSDSVGSKVRWRENADASNIYPTLKINDEKDKVILECCIFNDINTMSLHAYAVSDDQNARAKKAFKFQLLNPRAVYANEGTGYYFNSIVIFKPEAYSQWTSKNKPNFHLIFWKYT